MLFRLAATLQRERGGPGAASGERGSGSGGSTASGDSGGSLVLVVVEVAAWSSSSKLSRKMFNIWAFFIDAGSFRPRASIFCRSTTADQFPAFPSSHRDRLGLASPVAGVTLGRRGRQGCGRAGHSSVPLPLSTSSVARVTVSRGRRSVGLYL